MFLVLVPTQAPVLARTCEAVAIRVAHGALPADVPLTEEAFIPAAIRQLQRSMAVLAIQGPFALVPRPIRAGVDA